MNTETLRREALALPIEERARLAEQASLDSLTEDEAEQSWFREAARRAQELDQDLVQRIPAEEVSKEAWPLL